MATPISDLNQFTELLMKQVQREQANSLVPTHQVADFVAQRVAAYFVALQKHGVPFDLVAAACLKMSELYWIHMLKEVKPKRLSLLDLFRMIRGKS